MVPVTMGILGVKPSISGEGILYSAPVARVWITGSVAGLFSE